MCVCVCVCAEAIGCEYRLGDKWAALQTLEGASMTSRIFPSRQPATPASTTAYPPPTPPMSRPSPCSMAAAASLAS